MMAGPLPCDICQAEPAVQMLTNLQDGTTVTIGTACLVPFYGQSVLAVLGLDQHAGAPTKCLTCRKIHEQMAASGPQTAAEPSAAESELPGQIAIDDVAAAT